jgi:hypothetical protein
MIKKKSLKLAILTLNTAMQFVQKNYQNIDFHVKRQFCAENWRKSPKIEIIILTPGYR